MERGQIAPTPFLALNGSERCQINPPSQFFAYTHGMAHSHIVLIDRSHTSCQVGKVGNEAKEACQMIIKPDKT